MGIYLFGKYWSKHKGRLFALIFSIIILVATTFFSVLNERAQLRRQLHRGYDIYGNYSLSVRNISEEEEIREIKELLGTEGFGIVSAVGKLYKGETSYTIGCLENKEAKNFLHLPMTAGRMPEKAGEAALPEFLLKRLFPNKTIGDEITLYFEDLGGEKISDTYRLSGIIGNYTLRMDMEYWGDRNEVSVTMQEMTGRYPTPSIYIHKDSVSGLGKYFNYYICESEESYFSKESWESSDGIYDRLWEISDKYGSVVDGTMRGVVLSGMAGDGQNEEFSKVEESENIRVTRVIALFMVIVAALSMFSGVMSVMPKRADSLRLLHLIGMSKLKIFGIFITEFFFFWLIGCVAGLMAGCVVHETVLFIQGTIGLEAYRGYFVEMIVGKKTGSPFVMPLILSFIIAAASLIIPIKSILSMSSHKKVVLRGLKGRVRSFGRAFSRMTGARFTLILTFVSITVVVGVTVFGYCYYSQSGKGTTYFSLGSEDVSENYYRAGDIDLKKNEIDCRVSIESGLNDFRIPEGGYGITAGELKELNKQSDCLAWSRYSDSMVCYGKDEEYPRQLELVELSPYWEYYDEFKDKFKLCQLNIILLNENMMERLCKAGPDDVVLISDNGSFPYEVGESVPILNILSDSYGHIRLDSVKNFEIKITKQFNLNEAGISEDGILGECGLFGGCQIAMTAENAEKSGFYYPEYDNVLMKFRERADDRKIRSFISSSVGRPVDVVTIHELRKKAVMKRLSSSANSIMLFILLFTLNVITMWNLLGVNAVNNAGRFRVIHLLGISYKKIRGMFIRNTMVAAAAALIACTILSFSAKQIMSDKYTEYYSLLEQQQEIMGNTDMEKVIFSLKLSEIDETNPAYNVTAKMEALENTYMLKKEMWLPRLAGPLITIWLAVIISTLCCALLASRKIKDERVPLND